MRRTLRALARVLDYRTLVVACAFLVLTIVTLLIYTGARAEHDAALQQTQLRKAAARRVDLLSAQIIALQKALNADAQDRGRLLAASTTCLRRCGSSAASRSPPCHARQGRPFRCARPHHRRARRCTRPHDPPRHRRPPARASGSVPSASRSSVSLFRETRVLDYSSARPTIQQIKTSGASGVARYLTRSTSSKRLSAVEVRSLLAAGLGIVLVFEDTADRAKQGRAAGVADAHEATAQAKALGCPAGVPIFYAVDFDAAPAEVEAYFVGLNSVPSPYPVGAYGDIAVVDGLLGLRLARYGWQASAWSHHLLSKVAHLYQRQKATHPVAGTDENVVLRSFPQWTAKTAAQVAKTAAKAAPKPVPVVKPVPMPVVHDPRLVQFKGETAAVWEVSGSALRQVSTAAWVARALKVSDVVVLPAGHPLDHLPKLPA